MVFTPFIVPLAISVILLGAILLVLRGYRNSLSIHFFRILIAVLIIWTLSYALAISTVELELRLVWTHCFISATVLTPLLILFFVLDYTGLARWINRFSLPLLLLVPCASLAAEWLMLPVFRSQPAMDLTGAVPVLTSAKGLLYWVMTAYNAGLSLAALVVLAWFSRGKRAYERNTVLIASGIALPLVIGTLDSLGLTPVRGFDFSPASFSATSVLFLLSLTRHRLFHIVPIARNLIMDSVSDAIVVTNTQDIILDFNPAAARLVGGLRSGQCLNEVDAAWHRLLPAHAAIASGRFEAAAGPESQERVFDVAISHIVRRGGAVIGHIYIFHDITELRRYADELRKAQSLLVMSEKQAAIGRLTMGMAHKLNTPLGNGILVASYLRDQLSRLQEQEAGSQPDPQACRDFLPLAIDSMDHLYLSLEKSRDLIKGLRELGGPPQDNTAPPYPLRSFIEETLASALGGSGCGTRETAVDCDSQIRSILPREPLRIILNQCVANSLEHGFCGDGPDSIRISVTAKTNGSVELVYEDNGAGVDDETLGRLFEPFGSSLKNQRSAGLGTFIIHTIVTARLGGTINAERGSDGGLRYRIELPPGAVI